MGGVTFIPRTRNWKWFYDDAAEPTTQYANENIEYSGSGSASTIFRLRFNIAEIGGKAAQNQDAAIQWSTDQSNWNAMGSSSAWNYGAGQATDGNTVTSYKLTDTSTYGIYIESASTYKFTFGARSSNEFDYAITPGSSHSSGTRYYFRATVGGNGVDTDTSETYPSIVWTIAAVTPTPSLSISVTPSLSISVTPSLSISATPTPSLSISATPSLSISATPSLSISKTPTPSLSISATPSLSISITPSTDNYVVDTYTCDGTSCGTYQGRVNIKPSTYLQNEKWYILSTDIIIYIVSTTISNGVTVTVTQGPYTSCDDACSHLIT